MNLGTLPPLDMLLDRDVMSAALLGMSGMPLLLDGGTGEGPC